MTSLYAISDGKLRPAVRRALSNEKLIEDWVEADPSLLGLDAMIIGRQVPTDHGKFIDLLAMDATGGLIIIELKKDRTPREIVAQVLDYASWVRTLTTPEVYERAEKYLGTRLVTAFREKFGESIPERLNATHSMLIVASELDAASRRIVEYLSEEHGLAINTAFFNVFEADGCEWLTTDFLLDQDEVEERSERKVRAPWSGYYFVNAGLGEHRSWDDMKRYGFISAGGGEFYSKRLQQLGVGDEFFAYDKGNGYIGYGAVTRTVVPADEFTTPNGPLFDQPLTEARIKRPGAAPEEAEFAVGVEWRMTVDPSHAKRFKGAFANQNIVCKLRDEATVDFLIAEFDVERGL
ncbi:nuclease [Shimia thalassica]|uniref:nuclease n=1 Tax=Shimia thalassica TaxID=1715693 RepID=UPI00249449A9|nr:nuclease [Shimia thalassica]